VKTLVLALILNIILLTACSPGMTPPDTSLADSGISQDEPLGVNQQDKTKEQSTNLEREQSQIPQSICSPPPEVNAQNLGKIVFCSQAGDTQKSGDYYLYTINPDSSGMVKLPDSGSYMRYPAWSPERFRIAYASPVDNVEKIFVMAADGQAFQQITSGGGVDMFPTWSPDGNFIAYISYIEDTPNLWVTDLYGNAKQLTYFEDEDTALWPSWSPVSDVIAFTYNQQGSDIGEKLYTIKPDGTQLTELLSCPDARDHYSEPDWSPDGQTLYFFSNRSRHVEIWKVDYQNLLYNLAAGEEEKYEDIDLSQVSNLYGSGIAPSHRLRVSPKGDKLVFYGTGTDWVNIGYNLYVINTDGTNVANITQSINGDEWPDW